MMKMETIELALSKTKQQMEKAPTDPVLGLIESQLNYIRKVLTGKRPYRFRISRINVSTFGAGLFAETDPYYAALLMQSQDIVEELAQ